MEETRLYLLRHGQTDWNLRAALQGRADIPLNETGRAQAREAGRRLAGVRFDAVFSSPLARAAETARLATGWPAGRITLDRRLIEIDFGPYEGRDPHALGPEFAPFFTDPAAYRAPAGAESFGSLLARTGAFVRWVAAEYKGGTVLAVSHGAALHALLTAALAAPLERFWAVSLGNCRTAVLRADASAPGGWRLAESDGEGAGEYAQKYLG